MWYALNCNSTPNNMIQIDVCWSHTSASSHSHPGRYPSQKRRVSLWWLLGYKMSGFLEPNPQGLSSSIQYLVLNTWILVLGYALNCNSTPNNMIQIDVCWSHTSASSHNHLDRYPSQKRRVSLWWLFGYRMSEFLEISKIRLKWLWILYAAQISNTKGLWQFFIQQLLLNFFNQFRNFSTVPSQHLSY